ncbi:MAG: class II aldolase/adducin family protein, partial [Limisphaerales bacterium]
MKQIISVKDLEEMSRNGGISLPADAILTPSARDYMREIENGNAPSFQRSADSLVRDGGSKPAKPVTSKSSPKDIEAFFNSPEIHALKLQICDVGRRLWQRAYVDGNGGNIAIRVGEDIALCTPTLVSKGFMKPEDLCLVDLDGKQLAGTKKRTSEILMH